MRPVPPALPALLLLATSLCVAACDGEDPEPPPAGPVDDAAVTSEDTAVTVDVLANDPAELTLVRADADPNTGSVLVVDGRVVFAPTADFSGLGSFRYLARNSTGSSMWATCLVTIDPVNDAPRVTSRDVTTARNTAVPVGMTGFDVEGDALTYEIVTAPAHGDVSGSFPDALYTPAADFAGDDSFAFRIGDGVAMSEVAVVRIHVGGGEAPYASYASVAAVEDDATTFVLTGTDPEGAALTFAIVEPPSHGTLTGTAPALTYTPAPNFHGTDRLRFTVSDGASTSSAARIDLTVTPVDDAPTAAPVTLHGTEDVALNVRVTGVDVDGDPVAYQVSPPTAGQLTGNAPNLVYTPARDAHGVVAFSYVVTSRGVTTAPATITIVIDPVDDPPVAIGRTVAAVEDTAVAITLVDRNADGTLQTLAITSGPAHGTLSGTAPALTYTPARDFAGADRFTFTAAIGETTSAPAVVELNVAGRNDAPVARDAEVAAVEDTAVAITLVGSDIEGNSLSYQVVQPPRAGTLGGTGAALSYTPARDVSGDDAFTFTVSDGTLTSAPATVAIRIAAVNDRPVARDDVAMTAVDAAIVVEPLANDTDPEGAEPSLVSATGALHGTVTVDGDDLRYVPAAGFTGTETIRYTIVDDDDATATGVARIGVGRFPAGVPVEAVVSCPTPCTNSFRQPALSRDGRYLAFQTVAALALDDTNRVLDVYVHDRLEGTFERVSVASDGRQVSAGSAGPSISADGRRVAFLGGAELVTGDSNGVTDVFVRDLDAGTTVRVSVSSTGAESNAVSYDAQLSADGRHVAFRSDGFTLVANDVNGAPDVFVHDLDAGVTERISVTASGNEADLGGIGRLAISGDGQVVAFISASTNLVAGDTNGATDVFVRDRRAATTERVSVSSTGTQGDGGTLHPSISADGRFVVFLSDATTLITGDSNARRDVFFHDRSSHNTTRMSPFASATEGAAMWTAISADGRYVAFGSDLAIDQIYVRDVFAGTSKLLTTPGGNVVGDGQSLFPAFSADGRYIAFLSAATNLGGPQATVWSFLIAPNPL